MYGPLSLRLRGTKNLRELPGTSTFYTPQLSVFLLEYEKIVIANEGNVKERQGKLGDGLCRIDDHGLKRTYSNTCVKIVNVLGIDAARAEIVEQLRGAIG